MARIGNRTSPGRFTLGSWKDLTAQDAQRDLEHKAVAFERITVVRCLYREGADFPEHYHPQEQITIVEDGELEYRIGSETVLVASGEMISIEPGIRHSSRVPNGKGRALAINLFLKTERARIGGGTGIGTVLSPSH